jgi:multidrug efflux pump subunit AcrB
MAVPLKTGADIVITQGPSTIKRFNRERQATIGASLPIGVALDTAKSRFNEIVATNRTAGRRAGARIREMRKSRTS